MNQIEKLCKKKDIYPNISFGGKFLSVTIFFEKDDISIEEKEFSKEIDNSYEDIICCK
tara:strand:+ start:784 stop:957 length:174 start_codon:yes stop_codon:yes gene_type:complete